MKRYPTSWSFWMTFCCFRHSGTFGIRSSCQLSHIPHPLPLSPSVQHFASPPSGGRAKTSSVSVGTSPPFKIRCAVRQGGFIWGEEVVCCNEKGENTRQIGSPQWVTFKLPPDPYHITYCTHTIQTSVSSVFLLPSEKGGDKTIFLY